MSLPFGMCPPAKPHPLSSLNVPSHKTSLCPSLWGRHILSEFAFLHFGALKVPAGRYLNVSSGKMRQSHEH